MESNHSLIAAAPTTRMASVSMRVAIVYGLSVLIIIIVIIVTFGGMVELLFSYEGIKR